MDGVAHHSEHLQHHLQTLGWQVQVYTPEKLDDPNTGLWHSQPWGRAAAPVLVQLVQQQQITHLWWQYVPTRYQTKGLPLWWPTVVQKLAKTGVHQSIYFHEVGLRPSGAGLKEAAIARAQHGISPVYQKKPLCGIPSTMARNPGAGRCQYFTRS